MSKTVVIGNTKGGSGKSTVVLALALGFNEQGLRVAVIDADPQQNAAEFMARWMVQEGWEQTGFEPATPVSHCNLMVVPNVLQGTISKAISAASAWADVTLIDLQGSSNQSMLMSFGRADAVIMPMKSSAWDVAGLFEAVQSLANARDLVGTEIPGFALLTATRPVGQTKVSAHSQKQIERYGLDLLRTELMQRVAFEEMTYGMVPNFKEPRTKAAFENIQALTREVAEVLAGTWTPRASVAVA